MKQNGTQEHQVTHTGGRMIFPDYSPDGTKIAFSGHLPGGLNEDIFVAGADGSGPVQQLTSDPGLDANPAWSPDGSKIAFVRNFGNGNRPIYLMKADGTEQHPIVGGSGFVPGWQARGVGADDQGAG